MRRFDRRAVFASGTAAALLAASGVLAYAKPARGGRLRAALRGAVDEPWTAPQPSAFLNVARHAVLEGLTEIAADGTLRGSLATSWQSDDAGRHWAFELRAASWHDGSHVTAEQVAQVLGGRVQEGQVTLSLDAPDPGFPFRLAFPEWLVSHPQTPTLGTGLYALRGFEPGRRAIADRVDAHPKDGAAGWVDTLDITAIPAAETRLEALLHEMVDLIEHDQTAAPRWTVRLPGALAGARVAAPSDIGTTLPFDNFRCAERWWLV